MILNSMFSAGGSTPVGGWILKTESTSGTRSYFLLAESEPGLSNWGL